MFGWNRRYASRPTQVSSLLEDLGDPASANSPAAFANGEPQALLHGDRLDQLDGHVGGVAWHHHLRALWQGHHTRYVRGPEVELRRVVVEEWRVPAALVLGEHVKDRIEVGERGGRAGPD